MTNSPEQAARGYSFGMRLMHWVTAAVMIFVIIAGILIGNDIKLSFYPKLYDHHRAFGFLLLFIVAIRLIVKLRAQKPSPLPASVTPVQRKISAAVHHLLYAGLIIQPLLGWYATNAWGVKNIPFFFGMHLPQLADKDREFGNFLLDIHDKLGMFLSLIHI